MRLTVAPEASLMKSRTLAALCLLYPFTAAGCANMMTAKAIESFSESLAAANVEELRAATSERFEQRALRLPEAVDDFRILNLPTGQTSVLSVENVSDTMQHVTVQIGDDDDRAQTLEYQLTRKSPKEPWVVDDIYLTQQAQGNQAAVTKSIAEQMDLLLTVREFIDAWQQGAREDILNSSTEEFRSALAAISPAHLNQLAQQFLEGVGGRSLRPEARMEDDLAMVVVSAARGKLMIQFEREDDHWRVANLSPSTHEDTEPLSAMRIAVALKSATDFLKAYERDDRQALSKLATRDFFRNSLVAADLSAAPLPVTQMMTAPYELNYHGEHIELVLSTESSSFVFTLNDTSSDLASAHNDPDRTSYAVNEVTIYEAGTGQVKQLSSMFTAQAVVELYAQALGVRDLATLTVLSTPDFNERAWSRMDEIILRALPLSEIEPAPIQVVANVFKGPAVEVTVEQGSHRLTYVLHADQGRMLVDDVLLPVTRRPVSLKANIEVLAPLYGFARGIHQNNLDIIRRYSGGGLNRKVWSQTTSVPDIGFALSEHLLLPIKSIQSQGDQANISLTDGIRETDVTLFREGKAFVVQDVQLSVGDGEGQQVTLLQAMRDVLAQRFADENVMPAGYEQPARARQYVNPL